MASLRCGRLLNTELWISIRAGDNEQGTGEDIGQRTMSRANDKGGGNI